MILRLARLMIASCLAVGGCNCSSSGTAGGANPSGRTSASASSPAQDLERLGRAPLCEASALVRVGSEFWVADNEVEDRLFRFSEDLNELETWAMPRSDRPRDIEAMAYDGERLLVIGSHSPKRDGSRQERRHRTRVLRVEGEGLSPLAAFDTGRVEGDRGACMGGLFGSAGGDESPEGASAFCDAVAGAGWLNIEGATALEGRFWVGFRAPLVDGRAVIARLVGSTGALRFDRVRLIDLDGEGVRAMDSLEDALYLIAGPTADADSPHTLYRVDTDGHAERLSELPTSSEGLALLNSHEALVVIDGAEGNDVACTEPSRWTRVRW